MLSRKHVLMSGLAVLILTSCGEEASVETPREPAPLAAPSEALNKLAGFAGEYVVVDARRASGVSAPADLVYETPIGQTLRFTHKGVEMEGAGCDDWSITPSSSPVVYVETDPNLLDLVLGPTDSPISSGDQQQHEGYDVNCEGEHVFQLHKVDDRVLVMPGANGALNLILERPLSEVQIKAYQMQLKSMKFYSGELTGELDEATLRAHRYWYENRARLADDQPIPLRPAITENLLDALKVLQTP